MNHWCPECECEIPASVIAEWYVQRACQAPCFGACPWCRAKLYIFINPGGFLTVAERTPDVIPPPRAPDPAR